MECIVSLIYNRLSPVACWETFTSANQTCPMVSAASFYVRKVTEVFSVRSERVGEGSRLLFISESGKLVR